VHTALEITIRHNLWGTALDVELHLPGGATALVGPSGAGKTTILNIVAGLARADAGRIACNGEVLFDSRAGIDLPPESRRIAYVFQDNRLFPHRNVEANLRYGMKRRRESRMLVDFDEAVSILGIGHLLRRMPRNLSGGEAQRVAIGRALLSAPRLLLMDEPLGSLDGERKARVETIIERIRDGLRVPILFVSHDAHEVLRLADRVIAIRPPEPVRLPAAAAAGVASASEVIAFPTASRVRSA